MQMYHVAITNRINEFNAIDHAKRKSKEKRR